MFLTHYGKYSKPFPKLTPNSTSEEYSYCLNSMLLIPLKYCMLLKINHIG